MTQTHFQVSPLATQASPERDVLVQLAVKPTGKAVIFIHGFGGSPVETWSDFPRLLISEPAFRGVDAIYYGYDGLRADLIASAAIFRTFLTNIALTPARILNLGLSPSVHRPDGFLYSKITLVCHSLGAVIARRAQLDLATDAQASWISKTQLILFAPAHRGATIVELAKAISASGWLGDIFSFAKVFARFQSPLIDQLAKGSAVLTTLEKDARALSTKRRAYLRAKIVLIAEYEKIVENDPFPFDPPAIAIPKTHHTSVCKPKAGFLVPLEKVRDML